MKYTTDERIGFAEAILYDLLSDGVESAEVCNAVHVALAKIRDAGRLQRKMDDAGAWRHSLNA